MTILETRGLTKSFHGLTAVDDVDYHIDDGEIRCIIGPNGAGKTTFFNLVCGTLPVDKGTILFDQQDITGWAVHETAAAGIVRKYQMPSIYSELTVERNLGIAGNRQRTGDLDSRIGSVLERIELEGKRTVTAGSLSHGEKQWLEIGMILINDPKVMLLDEPTAGMTAESTERTADLVREINEAKGLTVVIIEHDIEFVRYLSVPITVLHRGKILAEGSMEQIEGDDRVQEVYLGRG